MKIKKIYVYFEGVLADFDGRVKELKIPPIKENCDTYQEYAADKYRFWKRIGEEKHFYESLAPLPGSLEMFMTLYEKYKDICEVASESDCVVLYDGKTDRMKTWFSTKDEGDGYDGIQAWMKKYLNERINLEISFYLSPDQKSREYILIDSRKKKIEEWCSQGGTGILYKNLQETLDAISDLEETFRLENKKLLADRVKQSVHECREKVAEIEVDYKKGLITYEECKSKRLEIARKEYEQIKKFCSDEDIDMDNEADNIYQTVHSSVGIPIRKVPIRIYPQVDTMTGSLYWLYRMENVESLFFDDDPIGKTFKFRYSIKAGNEKVQVDYYFKVKREDCEHAKKRASNSGGVWRCFDGYGKLEGYRWSGASISIGEKEGDFVSLAIQKMYFRCMEPIWKRHSAIPFETHTWLGIHEELPADLEIPEGGFYYDETIEQPPRGQRYREQGILAYDDTDEIVILGIKDPEAEVVEIPREINGKPVTILDDRCFGNCRESLRKVILPDTLKEIGDYAFEYCEQLEKPVIPPSVTKIGKDVFHCSCVEHT